MKFATKYSVVPYQKPIVDTVDYQITTLDQEMSSILDSRISLDEKVKLYGQTLAKFTAITNRPKDPSVLASLSSKVDDISQIIKQEFEDKDESNTDNIVIKKEPMTSTVRALKRQIETLSSKIENEDEHESVKKESISSSVNAMKRQIDDLSLKIEDQMETIEDQLDSVQNPTIRIDHEKIKQNRKEKKLAKLEAEAKANNVVGTRTRKPVDTYDAQVIEEAAKQKASSWMNLGSYIYTK